MFVGFLKPQIQSAIDRPLPTPTHKCKALGTNKSMKGFCKFFIKRPCLKFDFYTMSIACLQSELFESQLSKFTSVCPVKSAYFCMGAYKYYVVAVIKIGAYIHGSLFFMGS